MTKKINKNKDIFTINSYNQSGGTTAGQVNNYFAKQQRRLTDDLRQELRQAITKEDVITVEANLGDSEACAFANEIKSYLLNEEYNVKGVNITVRIPPPSGQSLYRHDNNKVMIIIGSI
jgi:hypothetical protein